MRKIVIDGRPFIKESTGIAVFLKCVVNSLSLNNNNTIYILLPQKIHSSINIIKNSNIHIIYCPLLRNTSLPRILWYFTKVPSIINKLNPDIYITPYPQLPFFISKKIIKFITIHDVVHLEFKSTMTFSNLIINKLLFISSLKRTNFIWCNSNYTKNKILEYYKYNPKNIFVGCSTDTIFYKKEIPIIIKEQILNKYNITNKFLLFVGTLEPRKNLRFLIEIMPQIYERTKTKCLIVGAKGWKNSDIYSLINSTNYPKEAIIFTGYISNEELVYLYNLADCYVSTSLNEGFGLPQLEAMLCGCDVISPANSAMIEIVESRGILIKGWNKDEWIEVITKKLETKNISKKNIDLSNYKWERIIEKWYHFINSKVN